MKTTLLSSLFFLILSCQIFGKIKKEAPYTVMISIDGFRDDYTDLLNLSFMKKMRKKGDGSGSINPVHPSKTFPNHLSMVTGLYPDEHGIVGNVFYQKRSARYYSIGDLSAKLDPSWYKGKPFWTLLEEKGIKTASFFWPVSDAPIDGILPSYLEPWDEKSDGEVPPKAVLERGLKWLKLPKEERPHFVALYLAKIDGMGHHHGAFHIETIKALRELDLTLEAFYESLKKLPFKTNLILCSDHGMTDVNTNKIIFLTNYIKERSKTAVKIIGGGSHFHLYVLEEDKKEGIYRELMKKKDSLIEVYKREDIPSEYHLSKSENTGDIFILVKPPYYMLQKEGDSHPKGDHGYDPRHSPEMKAIYYGHGPQISKQKIPVSETKDIFQVLKKVYKGVL